MHGRTNTDRKERKAATPGHRTSALVEYYDHFSTTSISPILELCFLSKRGSSLSIGQRLDRNQRRLDLCSEEHLIQMRTHLTSLLPSTPRLGCRFLVHEEY